MRLAGIGVLLGGVGSLVATRWFRSELYETCDTNPVTFGLAALNLVGIGLVATLLPARRSVKVEPARTLQSE